MQKVLAFSLNLHSKNNLTRKKVIEIQASAEENIINPLKKL